MLNINVTLAFKIDVYYLPNKVFRIYIIIVSVLNFSLNTKIFL